MENNQERRGLFQFARTVSSVRTTGRALTAHKRHFGQAMVMKSRLKLSVKRTIINENRPVMATGRFIFEILVKRVEGMKPLRQPNRLGIIGIAAQCGVLKLGLIGFELALFFAAGIRGFSL